MLRRELGQIFQIIKLIAITLLILNSLKKYVSKSIMNYEFEFVIFKL